MAKHPLSVIQENDAELFGKIDELNKSAFADGALAGKYKLLTALALDAAYGAAHGVKVLAQQALAAGATKEEILETLKVVYLNSGVRSVYIAAQGLEGII
jgi:alkylhydroperoxidase/carboxymuconolactone decarboxylase family protein YurZ